MSASSLPRHNVRFGLGQSSFLLRHDARELHLQYYFVDSHEIAGSEAASIYSTLHLQPEN